jgi:hypothetical protein
VPLGLVVVSEPVPPPLLPPGLQADKVNGTIAKLTAKALAQTVLDKLKAFILLFLLRL